MKYLILLTFISSISFGQQCPQNVQKLSKGQTANCDGYLFNPETELEARTAVATKDKMVEFTKIQSDMLDIQGKRIENFSKENERLQQRVEAQEKTNMYMNAIYFGLGVLVTGAIAVNVGH